VPGEQQPGGDPRAALERVAPAAVEQRGGTVRVAASQATGDDLRTVLDALKCRPPKPDGAGTLLTVSSALLVAYSVLKPDEHGYHVSGFELIVLLVVGIAAVKAAMNFFEARRQDSDPLNERAKTIVKARIAEAEQVERGESAGARSRIFDASSAAAPAEARAQVDAQAEAEAQEDAEAEASAAAAAEALHKKA
jgi:hypothetical protein